jgi:superfamily II DNA or RNA helicase
MLALLIAWKGTITQYAGRLHRPAIGKHDARIYDYVDAESRYSTACTTNANAHTEASAIRSRPASPRRYQLPRVPRGTKRSLRAGGCTST